MDANLAVVEGWLRDHPDTEFDLFLPPYSILFWEKTARLGETDAMFAALERTCEVLLPSENVKLYGDTKKKDKIDFYKSAEHKPSVTFHPYEPPAETPDKEYPFYMITGRLLEHWHTGSMTRRVPELDNALPEALMDMNQKDMDALGLKDGDRVAVTSRWGAFECTVSTAGRTQPEPGFVYIPFFAEETLVNMAQQECYCPLSKEPDFKKTCVNIVKVES